MRNPKIFFLSKVVVTILLVAQIFSIQLAYSVDRVAEQRTMNDRDLLDGLDEIIESSKKSVEKIIKFITNLFREMFKKSPPALPGNKINLMKICLL